MMKSDIRKIKRAIKKGKLTQRELEILLQYREIQEELQEKYALSGKMVLEYKQQSDSCIYKIESIKILLNSNN